MPVTATQQSPQQHPPGAPWNSKDAAAYLGISLRHLKALMSAGKLPSIKLGGRVLIADKVVQQAAQEGV